MAIESITADVFVDPAGHIVTLADSGGTQRRRRGAARADSPDPVRERLREALREADFEIAAEMMIAPPSRGAGPAGGRRRRSAAADPVGAPQASIAVGAGESAVLLLEAEGGVFSWQYADARSAAPATRRGARGGRTQLLTFTIGTPPAATGAADPAATPAQRRGPVLDWIGEKLVSPVRTYVLRFVVSKAIDVAVQRIEGDNPTGPVVIDGLDPAKWVPRPLARILPADRPARVLLMIHGTFSSTMGSFGQLAGTVAGKAFLTDALASYDLVLGSDHRTLADDPRANAEALLATLTALSPQPGTVIDAVSYSRGGLVYRVFAEQLLPDAGLEVTLGKAVFVACTNGGTNLAEPENWADMVDIYTNVVMAAARGIALLAGSPLPPGVGFAVRTLGRFVQMFSEVAISERKLPGLAAMEPDGALVTALNAAPDAARIADYYAVTSSFEPKHGLARGFSKSLTEFLADRITDRLFAAPNDLVVHTEAMTMFGAGVAIDPARLFPFGDTDEVYHTIYFADEAVAARISNWLGLAGKPVAALAPKTAARPSRRSRARRPVSIGGGAGAPDAGAADEAAPEIAVMAPSFTVDEVAGLVTPAPPLTVPLGSHPPGSVRRWNLSPPEVDLPDQQLLQRQLEEFQRRLQQQDQSYHNYISRPSKNGDAEPYGQQQQQQQQQQEQEQQQWQQQEPPEADAGVLLGGEQEAPPQAAALDVPSATIETPAPEPEIVERYLAAEMEAYPPLGPPANVYVTISSQLIEVAAHAAAQATDAPAQIDAARLLTLELIPRRNCVLVAGDTGVTEIDVRSQREIVTRLRVQGMQAGDAELIVEARQGARLITSFLLRPVFVAKDAPPLSVQQPIGAVANDENYPVLRIYEFKGIGGQLTLRFDLMGDDPALAISESKTLDPDFKIEAYVAGVLDEIEAAWDIASDSYASFLESFADSAVLRADRLVPLPIRTALWQNRDKIRAIQIISDEVLIPWELLCISDPTGQSAERRGFLSEWGMVRWFHGIRRPPRKIGFSGANSRSVVPRYLDPELALDGVEREEDILEGVLPGIVALEATSLAVRKFLAEDAAALDVLHFACHGEASEKAVLTAKLLMNGAHRADGTVIDDPLSADQVNVNLRLAPDRARSLIFLNSCQTGRGGRGIAGVAGFADAFIRPKSGRGAAVFVGALWSIDTGLAETFADHFYRALAGGKMLVDAVHEAREACKQSSDFTWLAYTIYGHPMAKISKDGL